MKVLPLILFIILSFSLLNGQKKVELPDENLFISTDRDVYFPEQEIYLKLWQNTSTDFNPSGLAYIELLTATNDVVSSKIVKLSKGGGAAIIEVPGNISSGFYIIRAYTSWLKNYGPDYFAYRKIMILNPLLDERFSFPEIRNYSGKTIRAGFYSEGGGLLPGINNRVYVKFENLPRNSLAGAFVSDESMDTLAFLNPLDENTAWFDFIPHSGKFEIRIPSIYPHKEISFSDSANSRAKLEFNEEYDRLSFLVHKRDTNLIFDSLRIFLKNHNEKNEEIIITENVTNDPYILLNEIPPGMNRFELKTQEGKVLSEKYYLKKNTGYLRVKINNGISNYSARDTVNINLDVSSKTGDPSSTIMNVFIRKQMDIIKQSDFNDFMAYGDYLHLEPTWDMDSRVYRQALATIYGEDFFEEKDNIPDLLYQRDSERHSIKGIYNNGVSEGKEIFLSFPGDSSEIFITRTDENGEFEFHLPHISSKKESAIKTSDSIADGFLVIEEPFYPDYKKSYGFPASFDSSTVSILNNLYREWRIDRYYQDKHIKSGQIEKHMFYDQSDFYVLMDNYIDFPNMAEVFFEIIKPVMIFDQNKRPWLKIIDRETNRTLGNNPLYVIDGVPFTDPVYAMGLHPDRVRDIAIVARSYYIGPEVFDGIIIINTHSNDLSDVDPEMVYLRQKIVFPESENIIEINPQPGKENIPFSPSLNYWNSSVQTGSDGECSISFVAPDKPGEYVIQIEAYDTLKSIYGFNEFNIQIIE